MGTPIVSLKDRYLAFKDSVSVPLHTGSLASIMSKIILSQRN